MISVDDPLLVSVTFWTIPSGVIGTGADNSDSSRLKHGISSGAISAKDTSLSVILLKKSHGSNSAAFGVG